MELANLIKAGIRVFHEEGFTVFIKKLFRFVYTKVRFVCLKIVDLTGLGYVLAPFIAHEIRKLTRNFHGIQNAVAFAFSFERFGVSIKPCQIEYEIAKLIELVYSIKPKVILEIGTANGGSLFLFTRVAESNATLISIDLPGGMFGGGYPRWKIPIYKAFARENQKIFLIRADSHNPATLKKLVSILGGRKIDFLSIDGDHIYKGVKKDFETYSPLVRKGGIIAFHDIVPAPQRMLVVFRSFGVK
ncbi:MAG: class I SAM-dependent methyltransferase [Candidatus Bathyarchaeia archaeon]